MTLFSPYTFLKSKVQDLQQLLTTVFKIEAVMSTDLFIINKGTMFLTYNVS